MVWHGVLNGIVIAATTLFGVSGGMTVGTAWPASDLRELWKEPTDLATRDLFNGPWGAAHAPDPHDLHTARLAPVRGDPAEFEQRRFIKRIDADGFVEFDYNGRHQNIVDHVIPSRDVYRAATLLSRVSEAQWHDAFRADGYSETVRTRFITKLQSKIRDGLAFEETE